MILIKSEDTVLLVTNQVLEMLPGSPLRSHLVQFGVFFCYFSNCLVSEASPLLFSTAQPSGAFAA